MKAFLTALRRSRAQTLAEFAVSTAMMATLATTAAPKFSGIGEGAKEKKTMAEIDKIVTAANNWYNKMALPLPEGEGRGRFPGQERYDSQVGGYSGEQQLILVIGDQAPTDSTSFYGFTSAHRTAWKSVFGINHVKAPLPAGSQGVLDDTGSRLGHVEFLEGFGQRPSKSPYQDGHFIYIALPGGVKYTPSADGTTYTSTDCGSCPPILYVADLERPVKFFKKLKP